MKTALIKKLTGYVLVALLIVLSFAVVSWPLITRLTTHTIGTTKAVTDASISPLWFSWYVSSRLGGIADNPSLLRVSPLWFHPFGIDLNLSNPCHHITLAAVAFRPFTGFPADINLHVLFILLINGLCFFAAAKKCGAPACAAALTAVLFAVNPFSMDSAFQGNND